MSLAALFITHKNWKPKCLPMDEWINKMWHMNGILFINKKE